MRKDKKELLLFWDMVAPFQTNVVAFYDTFTDTDSTLLPNHTPDISITGNGWVTFGGDTYQIISNQAEYNGGSPANAIAITNMSTPNVVVRTRFTLDSGGDPAAGGLTLRSSADGVIYIQLRVDPEEDDVNLVRAGTIDSAVFVTSPGDVIEITATCLGDTTTALIENVTTSNSVTLEITESTASANTRFGLFTNAGAGPEPSPTFDWIEIRR
jgi:hypothetical protein